MSGETAGVEYKSLDTVSVIAAVYDQIVDGDFSFLTESAEMRIYEQLDAFRQHTAAEVGSFFVRLYFEKSIDVLLNPEGAEWAAVEYEYLFDENAEDPDIWTLGAFMSTDEGAVETLTQVELGRVLTIAWDEVMWTWGYSLLLGEDPEDILPSIN